MQKLGQVLWPKESNYVYLNLGEGVPNFKVFGAATSSFGKNVKLFHFLARLVLQYINKECIWLVTVCCCMKI